MKRKFDRLITVFLALTLMAGVALLAYPSVSDYWNSFHQTKAVTSYGALVEQIDAAEREKIRESARLYNEDLVEREYPWVLSDEQREEYESQLAMDSTGIMGYVEIPSLRCTLPVDHGTEESVLQTAIGHIEGSSLPVGGPSTHSVLSGHRGLPTAKLFTDLDKLSEGDTFMLRVLDETLTYEVDQIRIVEPHEVQDLEIVEGEDYCTLVTCTPYGINTHRLLVRGYRVETVNDASLHVNADALLVDPDIVSACIAIPVLWVLFAGAMVWPRKQGDGQNALRT